MKCFGCDISYIFFSQQGHCQQTAITKQNCTVWNTEIFISFQFPYLCYRYWGLCVRVQRGETWKVPNYMCCTCIAESFRYLQALPKALKCYMACGTLHCPAYNYTNFFSELVTWGFNFNHCMAQVGSGDGSFLCFFSRDLQSALKSQDIGSITPLWQNWYLFSVFWAEICARAMGCFFLVLFPQLLIMEWWLLLSLGQKNIYKYTKVYLQIFYVYIYKTF